MKLNFGSLNSADLTVMSYFTSLVSDFSIFNFNMFSFLNLCLTLYWKKEMATIDRLSDLPSSIILHILEFVPTRDAVRTSVLSRQWRRTWTTLPHLSIGCDDEEDELMEGYKERMIGSVNNVLFHHKGPIHKFEIFSSRFFKFDLIEEWVLCLSRNDIRELIIHINFNLEDGANLLKCGLYSCTKLTNLELWDKLDPPPSNFKGFMFLTSLELEGVELSPDGLENLVANCPLLERLKMQDCVTSELIIHSPNLKDLHLFGDYTKLCLYAPLLDNLYVHLMVIQFTQSRVCNYTNFLGAFTNLVKLRGGGYFILYLSFGIESCHPTTVFHHLETIELTGVNYEDIKEMTVVTRLIIDAPNLQKLHLMRDTDCKVRTLLLPFEELGFPSKFTHEKLRDVSMPFGCNHRLGMQLIKLLLESSPVLETMELCLTSCTYYQNVSEVLGLYQASPNVRIY